MVLNTTEFLLERPILTEDLANYYVLREVVVDDNPEIIPSQDIPLVQQKNTTKGSVAYRYLHNYPTGQYHVGRHISNNPTTGPLNTRLLWYAFAPWTKEFIDRKLQIKNKIPQSDKDKGFGFQHLWTVEQMEQERLRYLNS